MNSSIFIFEATGFSGLMRAILISLVVPMIGVSQATETREMNVVEVRVATESAAFHSQGQLAQKNPLLSACNAVYSAEHHSYSGTDATKILQDFVTRAGLALMPSIAPNVQGADGNAPEGVVDLPLAKKCLISATIIVPAGVSINFNHSEVHMSEPGTAFEVPFIQSRNVGFGNFYNQFRNGLITGPGATTSKGSGIYVHLGNKTTIDNLDVSGFREGLTLTQTQYSNIDNSNFHNNFIGGHLAADIAYPTLPSIDDTFYNSNFRLNRHINLWNQGCIGCKFFSVDANFPGAVGYLAGGQMAPYISGWTLKGGSGCTPSSKLPVSVSDSTGHMAAAYVSTNVAGVPIGITRIEGGEDYTAPTATVPGCRVQPVITMSITNDRTISKTGQPVIGEYLGIGKTNVGNDKFYAFKAEAISTTNDTGYHIIIGPGAQGDQFFSADLSMDGGSEGFTRIARIEGADTEFIKPKLLFYPQPNPSDLNDVCAFRTLVTQGLDLETGIYNQSDTNLFKYSCNKDGGADFTNTSYHGFSGDGSQLGSGFRAQNGWHGSLAFASNQLGDSNWRYSRTIGGDESWSDGRTLDITLGRTKPGLWGIKEGGIDGSQFPLVVGNAGGNPMYTQSVFATNAEATSGIPSGSVCEVQYRWTGVGTGAAAIYNETAVCNLNGEGVGYYQSVGKVRGHENFMLLQTIHSDGSVSGAALSSPMGVCNVNGAWSFSQDGHASVCSNGKWMQKL